MIPSTFFVYGATVIEEASCKTLSVAQPGGFTYGKHVGDANSTEPSGKILPRATVAISGERRRMICPFLLLKKSSCVVVGALPMTLAVALPPPSRLPAGQAAAPRVESSRSLAVHAAGTLVSQRSPSGL